MQSVNTSPAQAGQARECALQASGKGHGLLPPDEEICTAAVATIPERQTNEKSMAEEKPLDEHVAERGQQGRWRHARPGQLGKQAPGGEHDQPGNPAADDARERMAGRLDKPQEETPLKRS